MPIRCSYPLLKFEKYTIIDDFRTNNTREVSNYPYKNLIQFWISKLRLLHFKDSASYITSNLVKIMN